MRRARSANRASFGPTDDLIRRVAGTDVTVLICGERGTGKELAARAIHAASERADRPFVKVDCASDPTQLDAELFGCDCCTPTPAGRHRPGRLEFATHGTLFLDRVGELPLALQHKLSDLLEEGERARSRPVGAHPGARLIASTEQELAGAVGEGRFHEPLYLRLNVVSLTLVPLRQRRAELPRLTDFFVRQYAAHFNKPESELSEHTLDLLSRYDWPGNVEELDTIVKRIVMLGTEEAVMLELGQPASRTSGAPSASPDTRRVAPKPMEMADQNASPVAPPVPLKELGRLAAEQAERELIFRTLHATRWNRREAAEMLGVSYKALLYKIKRAELDGAC